MKIFKSFLIYSKNTIILTIILLIVFNFGLYLYSFHDEIFIYLNIISIFIILMFFLISFYKYYHHYLKMMNYLENILYIDDVLESKELVENKYLKTISNLKNDLKNINNENIKKNADLIDYYTLWIHQIKTPIAAMRLILSENKDLRLNMELLRIEEYVEMVISYLKVMDKDSDFVFKDTDLDTVISETIKYYSSIFILKKIKVNFSKTNFRFVCDEKWLSFIIGQILSNSLKYTKNNGEIKIYMMDNILYIEDNGIGIKKEDLPRIFEKGYSGFVGREYKRASGIGLYLVKKICDNLNIEIKIDSILNEKTIVSLKLDNKNNIYE